MQTQVDWLRVVLAVSLTANFIGIIWSIYRELLNYELSKRLTWTSRQILSVMRSSTVAIEKLNAAVDQSEVRGALVDLEQRLSALIRDMRCHHAPSTEVNFNSSSDGVQVTGSHAVTDAHRITVSGSTGTDIAGGNITKTGNTSGDGGNGQKWLMLAIIAIVLIIGLAWGANAYRFRVPGVSGESLPSTSK